MLNNIKNSCIIYDKTKNISIMPKDVDMRMILNYFINPSFYIVFKHIFINEPKIDKLHMSQKDNSGKDFITETEGFAILLGKFSNTLLITKGSEPIDAVRFQYNVLKKMSKQDQLGGIDVVTGYVLELIDDYMLCKNIHPAELSEIFATLKVHEYTNIPEEYIEKKLKERHSERPDQVLISEEEYLSAIKGAKNEFGKKNLEFYGEMEDAEAGQVRSDFLGSKEDLIYSGVLVATFSKQKDFDAFLKICRDNYILNSFTVSDKMWRYKKYFYFEPTDGNLRLCATDSLDGIYHDGIVDGEIFSR